VIGGRAAAIVIVYLLLVAFHLLQIFACCHIYGFYNVTVAFIATNHLFRSKAKLFLLTNRGRRSAVRLYRRYP
jgi:hypothetical protein